MFSKKRLCDPALVGKAIPVHQSTRSLDAARDDATDIKFLRRLWVLTMTTLLLIPPMTAQAADSSASAGGLFKGLDACLKDGNCTICELFSVLSNAVNIMVEIAGGVALGMLLWNAFGLVTSRGNAEAVKGTREGIWKLAIGFFFLLLSYELVILTIRLMAGNFNLAPPWKDLLCTRT